MQKEQKTKAAKPEKVAKIIRSVVMRVTADEAAKLKYQRKFDRAWAKEQAHDAALFAKGQDQRDCYAQSALTPTPCVMGGVIIRTLAETEQDEQEDRDRVAFNFGKWSRGQKAQGAPYGTAASTVGEVAK